MNLLLAEDDPVSRSFLMEVLSTAGHRVSACGDGPAALSEAIDAPFDLLLLDLNLPGLRADQLLSRLRSTPDAANALTPAIVLTADLDPQRHRDLLAAGFARAASKPLTVAELLALIAGQQGQEMTQVAAESSALPDWDDAAALLALGGNRRALDSLRGLFRLELATQRQRLATALASGECEVAAGELHRLRAACGFCGAARLGALARGIGAVLEAGCNPAKGDIACLDAAFATLLQSEVAPTAGGVG